MASHQKSNPEHWQGRTSGQQLYLHEKVLCPTDQVDMYLDITILGYACDEGVSRNQGRIGAIEGPEAIRGQLAKMPNHLAAEQQFIDLGNIECTHKDMEEAQRLLAAKLAHILDNKSFPILLGGGHDIAYGHFKGLRKHLGDDKRIGIINFDAHFDLRDNTNGNNSGTPFYQIAHEEKAIGQTFNYLCLGIRRDANDAVLYETAKKLGASYLEKEDFNIRRLQKVQHTLEGFMARVDVIFVTIDLDGFSSAFAPGVSAPSPMGFSPDIVLECLKTILKSKKMIGMDLAEMNPRYDIEHRTAKLAASLVHFVIHNLAYDQL